MKKWNGLRKRAMALALGGVFILFGAVVYLSAPEAQSTDKPIVIGTATSVYTAFGRDYTKALELAIEELNAKGGVEVGGVKRQFRMVFADTRDSEPGVPVHDAIMALERLILKEKPDFIVGAFHRSEALLAAMDMIADHKIITFSGSPQTPLLTKRIQENYERYKYIFRANTNAAETGLFWGRALKHINEKYGLTNLFFVGIDFEWAKATANGLKAVAEAGGWKTVGSEYVPAGNPEFSSALTKAKAAGAQLIILLHDLPEAPICVRQWKAMKIPSMLAVVWTPAVEGPRSWQMYGDVLNFSLAAEFPAGSSFPIKALPGTDAYVDAWMKKYGGPPETSSSKACTYPAMQILADAIKRAGTLDTNVLIKAIEEADIKDPSGRIRFNKENHQMIISDDPAEGRVFAAFQWRDGGQRLVVYPRAIADQEIQLPPWMK
jgi:branched-chain amino acid transport system substrate-binding protein